MSGRLSSEKKKPLLGTVPWHAREHIIVIGATGFRREAEIRRIVFCFNMEKKGATVIRTYYSARTTKDSDQRNTLRMHLRLNLSWKSMHLGTK